MFIVLVLSLMAAIGLAGCTREQQKPSVKLQVVTTLFPLYDFARIIAGDRAEVSMLLPPGMEPHNFEPKPNDIIRISKAGLFIYTNPYMEHWAEKIIKGIDRQKLQVVNAGQGAAYEKVSSEGGHETHAVKGVEGHAVGMDPHIWLDFANAGLIVNNILAGFVAADPVHAPVYRDNAAKLNASLAALDRRYREGLSSCASRVFPPRGHHTLWFMAPRFGPGISFLSGFSLES